MQYNTHTLQCLTCSQVVLTSSESSIVCVLSLVVHYQLALHKVEAVRFGLERCCNDVMLCTKPGLIVFKSQLSYVIGRVSV